ncbi:MAG: sigma-70 family RNA polymerase sigma factor [bacterium]
MNKTLRNGFRARKEKDLTDFEQLAYPLLDRLFRSALSMTKNLHDAEDLLQSATLKAWRYFHWFEQGTNFEAWIFRILTNLYINEYRRRKRQPLQLDFETTCQWFMTAETDGLDYLPANREFELEPSPNYADIFDDCITTALDLLPEKYRLVVVLADVSRQKYKHIAEILHLPIGTVMSRLNRGRKMLAESLRDYAETNGYLVATG